MTAIQLDNRISIGNIITVGIMIVTFIAGYVSLQNRVEFSEAKINKMDSGMSEIRGEIQRHADRSDATYMRIDVMHQIIIQLDKLDKKLDEIDKEIRRR